MATDLWPMPANSTPLLLDAHDAGAGIALKVGLLLEPGENAREVRTVEMDASQGLTRLGGTLGCQKMLQRTDPRERGCMLSVM